MKITKIPLLLGALVATQGSYSQASTDGISSRINSAPIKYAPIKSAITDVPTAPTVLNLKPQENSSVNVEPFEVTTVYRDVNGADDIAVARLSFDGSNVVGSGFAAQYADGKLSFSAGFGTPVQGGFAPGSSNVITNKNAALDCSKTTVTKSGTDLTIKWHFTTNNTQLGRHRISGFVFDRSGQLQDWKPIGFWTFLKGPDSPPTTVSVAPASGDSPPDMPYYLTTVYRDANGAHDISEARLLVNSSLKAGSGLAVRYKDNRLYLADDAGNFPSTDVRPLPGAYPGAAKILSNSQGSLDCSQTTVTKSGNDLIIKWAFIPNAPFHGEKKVYSLVLSYGGSSSNWEQMATWNIDSNAPTAPFSVKVSPLYGRAFVNAPFTLTSFHTDRNGAASIADIRLLINSGLTAANGLVVRYTYGKLYLANDAGTGFIGGFAPGSANVISNSQGSLDCSKIVIARSGNTLAIKWPITPKTSFIGFNTIYALVSDVSGLGQPWTALGNLKVEQKVPSAPRVVRVSPASSSLSAGALGQFDMEYSDENGFDDIVDARIAFNATLSGAGGLVGRYTGGKLYLASDDGLSFLGGFAPGSANVITNSQGSLDCSQTVVALGYSSQNGMLIRWAIKPKESFGGLKKIYGQATDKDGLNRPWNEVGSVTISGAAPQIVSASPTSGSSAVGANRNFTVVYRDLDGVFDIDDARFFISDTQTGKALIGGSYEDGELRVVNPGEGSTTGVGTPGQDKMLWSPNGLLDCSKTTVTRSGNDLIIKWSFIPNENLVGAKFIAAQATDFSYRSSERQPLGTWTITGAPAVQAPSTTAVVVPSGNRG